MIYLESLTEKEAAVVAEAKSKQSIVFLQGLKNAMNGGSVTSFERRILEELTAMRLPDEVINIIVLYTFNRNQKANLVRNYVLMIANDFSYKQVTTAEAAVLLLRPKQQQVEKQSYKSNVPSWGKSNYRNTPNPEKRAELEKEKLLLLQKLREVRKVNVSGQEEEDTSIRKELIKLDKELNKLVNVLSGLHYKDDPAESKQKEFEDYIDKKLESLSSNPTHEEQKGLDAAIVNRLLEVDAKLNEDSNIPEWSNPYYKDYTTHEEKEKLEEKKRKLLEKLKK